MSDGHRTTSAKRRAAASAAALALLGAGGPQRAAVPYPDPDVGAATLTARRAQQLEAAASYDVRLDFAFADRLPDSGISFRHRVVDDAALTYQAAHYDHGTALGVADVDGDGLLDLYFVNQIGANELWRGLGDGRFENITERAGVGVEDRIGVGASFADIDNDGDADLFVSTVRGGNLLFENDGRGAFTDISVAAGVDYVGHSSGAVFFDYDRDGRLDLLVTNVGDYTHEERGPGGFYRARADAFQGHLFPERTESSILYRNAGENRFEDVSAALGFADEAWNGDATLVDFNGDDYPDLYLLNMQGTDRYWENRAGERFVESTAELFPKTPWGAMGVKSFDHDNDGDLDLLITDMHSDMNDDVGPERELDKQRYRYVYQEAFNSLMGNAFFRNDGDGAFTEVSDAIGLENYWPWGTSVGDVNADGFQDVFLASSMNYPFRYGINSLRLNVGGERFVAAEFVLGVEPRRDGRVRTEWFDLDCDAVHRDPDATALWQTHCEGRDGPITVMATVGSRTSAIVDLDNDGDLDIVTGDFNSEPQLLISDLADRGAVSWLKVELEGTRSNRDGLGSTVTVSAGDARYTRFVDGKTGYLSQGRVPLYFGLGDTTTIDSVVVRWPDGGVQTVTGDLPVNTSLRIRQE